MSTLILPETFEDRAAKFRNNPPKIGCNDDYLREWARYVLKMKVPSSSFCTGHDAPLAYLRTAWEQQADDVVVWANRGGGKTMLGAAATLMDAVYRPGTRIRILGGSLEQSERMFAYLRPMVDGHFRDRLAKGRSSTGRVLRFANGSEIEVLAQSERSVRGNRVQKMRCDEVELFDPDVWTSCQLVTETRGESRGTLEIFSTMHRPHGLMQQIVADADGRQATRVVRWCVLDAMEKCTKPASFCKQCPLEPDCHGGLRDKQPGQIGHYRIDDAIAARRRVSKELWEAEMLCKRPSRRGAVFPTFDREKHVAPLSRRAGAKLYRSIDFGFVNPFICLWLQRDGDGNVEVLREYARSQATLSANIARVRDMDPDLVRLTFCDPAGNQRNDQTGTSPRAELRAAGMPTMAHPSRIVDGLERIRRLLDGDGAAKGPMLRIDPSCRRLIAAMEAYRYPEPGERTGDDRELPVKDGVHDHPIDALRYALVNLAAMATARIRERLY